MACSRQDSAALEYKAVENFIEDYFGTIKSRLISDQISISKLGMFRKLLEKVVSGTTLVQLFSKITALPIAETLQLYQSFRSKCLSSPQADSPEAPKSLAPPAPSAPGSSKAEEQLSLEQLLPDLSSQAFAAFSAPVARTAFVHPGILADSSSASKMKIKNEVFGGNETTASKACSSNGMSDSIINATYSNKGSIYHKTVDGAGVSGAVRNGKGAQKTTLFYELCEGKHYFIGYGHHIGTDNQYCIDHVVGTSSGTFKERAIVGFKQPPTVGFKQLAFKTPKRKGHGS